MTRTIYTAFGALALCLALAAPAAGNCDLVDKLRRQVQAAGTGRTEFKGGGGMEWVVPSPDTYAVLPNVAESINRNFEGSYGPIEVAVEALATGRGETVKIGQGVSYAAIAAGASKVLRELSEQERWSLLFAFTTFPSDNGDILTSLQPYHVTVNDGLHAYLRQALDTVTGRAGYPMTREQAELAWAFFTGRPASVRALLGEGFLAKGTAAVGSYYTRRCGPLY